MDKEFYDKYSKDLECSCCQDLEYCINGKEPLKINCAIHYFKDKIAELETKLAEKEKEVKELKKGVYKVTLGTTPSNQIDVTENFYVVQNQTVIEELEKVKRDVEELHRQFCQSTEYRSNRHLVGRRFIEYYPLVALIDQQIKSLKGEDV